MRILIVDDSSFSRTLLKKPLVGTDHDLVEAKDGLEAL